VEDPFGHKFPVPSEYDFPLLQASIRQKFSGDGLIPKMVQGGEYELSYASNSSQIISVESRFKPGSQVIMAVILSKLIANRELCPMPRCNSAEAKAVSGGGYRWQVSASSSQCNVIMLYSVRCDIWFDESTGSEVGIKLAE
jgi:ubiquitin domain-containing protein